MRAAYWDTAFVRDSILLRRPEFGMSETAKRAALPFRAQRYWFMYHLLREEAARLGRPLDVCEIGVDRGQLLMFMRLARGHGEEAPLFSRWTAVDCKLKRETLRAGGYRDLVETDIDRAAPPLGRHYDALVLLHVLEHLREPEAALARLLPLLRPGGIVIGGHPVTPEPFRLWREQALRRRAKPFGHVSVFSPQRVRAMATAAELNTEFLTGAFFMRKKGFFLENHDWWWRLNLRFGARFPGWPGELYWRLRRPQAVCRKIQALRAA